MSDWKADKQQLVQLAEELERRGWQANERGDVQCYDQACAMAAELARDRINGDTIQIPLAEYEKLKADAERLDALESNLWFVLRTAIKEVRDEPD